MSNQKRRSNSNRPAKTDVNKTRDSEPHEPPESWMRILAAIRAIPRGKTASYGEIARRARLPGRARLVGYVLRHCPLSDAVPWHRVLRSGDRIALRDGRCMDEQRQRLVADGFHVDARGKVRAKPSGADRAGSRRSKTR